MITVTPAGCEFTTTWSIHRASDNADMEVVKSTIFTISAASLDLVHTVSNYAQRISQYGNTAYYFKATISDSKNTESSHKSFNINWTDACR